MSDGDALLKAVLGSPADDTARLVYADWLNERGGSGDAERAEFIRRQIRLLRMPGSLELDAERDQVRRWLNRYIDNGHLAVSLETDPDWFWSGDEAETILTTPQSILHVSRGFISRVEIEIVRESIHEQLPTSEILVSHPITAIRLPAFRAEIDPPGTDHGWQIYYYLPENDGDYFAMSGGLDTRAEMIDRLLADVRDLEAEFA